MVFFLPAILSDNHLIGFGSYAMAHGLQYWIFMVVLAKGSERPWTALPVLGILTILLYAGFVGMASLHGGLRGAYFGVVAAHFVIDAKVWRLREATQRKIVGGRFAFLFK
jgi:hypothetical protein